MTDRELMQQALDALNLELPSGAYLELKNALRDRLAKPEQEPVAWYDKHGMVTHDPFEGVTPLYTTTPQRPWVGLTDEELSEVYNNSNWDFKQSWDYERAIEDKLRSKNT